MSGTTKSEKTRRFDRLDAVILLVLIAVILYYFRRIIWTHEYIYGELDIRRHFFFFRQVSYNLMRNGELPLWLSQIYCGMPLLAASQVTPYYPVDLALMLTGAPLNMVFNWGLLIHLAAAQVFSYLLFKRMLGNRIATVFGSIWFWNAFFLKSIATGDALNIRAMLLVPVVFYFVEAGMSADSRPRDFLFGALALTMQIMCGGLQNTFYTMAAAGAYVAFRLFCRKRDGEDIVRPALGFSAMIVLGLALSGVQLLPAWEYSRLSVRSAPMQWFKYWAIKPYQLIGYVVPMFEGVDRDHGYFGMATIALAAYSLPLWKSRRKYFFLVLGAIAIVYSFGGNTTISSFIGNLPLVRGFRGPYRGAIFFDFSLFALAAGALKGFLEPAQTVSSTRKWIAMASVTVVLAAGFVATALAARNYSGFDAMVVVASALFLALSILAVNGAVAFRKFARPAAMLLVALLVAELALYYRSFYRPMPMSEAFAKDWTIDFLDHEREQGDFRIAVYNTAHTNYFALFGIESATGHHPFPTIRYASFLPLLSNPRVASLAGVKYYIVYGKDANGVPYDPPVDRHDQVSFTRVPVEPLPRAFLVHRFAVKQDEAALEAMQEYDFDPRKEVILERAPAGITLPDDKAASGSAAVVSRRAENVAVETESATDSILVLTETFYPGWIAEVDGVRTEVLSADHVFRAVPLSAGKHQITFKFRSRSFLVGAAISFLAMVCWAGWALILFLRRTA